MDISFLQSSLADCSCFSQVAQRERDPAHRHLQLLKEYQLVECWKKPLTGTCERKESAIGCCWRLRTKQTQDFFHNSTSWHHFSCCKSFLCLLSLRFNLSLTCQKGVESAIRCSWALRINWWQFLSELLTWPCSCSKCNMCFYLHKSISNFATRHD